MKKFFMFCAALMVFCEVPIDLRAGGMSYIDFGYRRNGMLTVMGRPDDGTAVFHNPAGLALQDYEQILLQACGRFINLNAKIMKSDGTYSDTIDPGFVFAVNPFISYSGNFGLKDFGWGLAFYVPTGIGAKMPEDEPTRYHVKDGYYIGANLTLAFAYRILESLSAGAGISGVMSILHAENYINLRGLMTGLGAKNDWDFRFDPEVYNNEFDYKMTIDGSDLNYTFNIGLLFNPVSNIGIGVCYTRAVDVDLEGDITVVNVVDPEKKDEVSHKTQHYIPGHIRAGINYDTGSLLEIGFDYTCNFYKYTPDQITRLEFEEDESYYIVKYLILEEEYGGGKGLRTERDLNNNHNFSLGFMFHVLNDAAYARALDLMLGIQYDKTPYPTKAFSLFSPTRDYAGANVGLRWMINDNWVIGFGWGFTYCWDIHVEDSNTLPPMNVDATASAIHLLLNVSFRF